jgi:hypothetical protein
MSHDALVSFIAIAVLATAASLIRILNKSTKSALESRKPRRASQPVQDNLYPELRRQGLDASREKFGLPAKSRSNEPWGVVMDWALGSGTATIVALSDGNASIYRSSGGGHIGGKSHDSIRKSAQKAVAVAGEFQSFVRANGDYSLPKQGTIIFYTLTDDGVFMESVPEEDLREHRHPLSKLGDAIQDIITQYSRIEA